MSKIMLFIPMYNCGEQIPRVLSKINGDILTYVQEVVLIDNNSSDNTVQAAIESSKKLPMSVKVLQNKENYNLGGSIKNALLYALQNEYTHMIVLHGDDQANINDLLPVLSHDAYKQNELCIGSRFHPESTLEGYSWFRTFGNKVFNFLFESVVKQKVYDMIAGLNIYSLEFFKDKSFLKFPNDLTFDAHLLLSAFDKKANVYFFPMSWRDEDQISNARVFKQAKVILKLLLSYRRNHTSIFEQKCDMTEEDYAYKVLYEKDKDR